MPYDQSTMPLNPLNYFYCYPNNHPNSNLLTHQNNQYKKNTSVLYPLPPILQCSRAEDPNAIEKMEDVGRERGNRRVGGLMGLVGLMR